MSVINTREDAFVVAKDLARDNDYNDLYESLVLQYTNPKGEWGRNNIRDLVMLFHMSGHSPEKIYNILYTMGIEKQTAYDAIKTYIPQNNTLSMAIKVKENLDFTNNLRDLVDSMNEYKTADSSNYNADTVISLCEEYLNTNKENLSVNQVATLAKTLVSNLKPYDFSTSVKECIDIIEKALFENSMSVSVSLLKDTLNRGNHNGAFSNILDRISSLETMNESEIKLNIENELGQFKELSSDVKFVLESIATEEEAEAAEDSLTLSERFNLKGRLKAIIEAAKEQRTESSAFTMDSVSTICEKYINKLYTEKHVSESTHAGNLISELSQFDWLNFVRESASSIKEFLNENYMSFELKWALNELNLNSNKKFYSEAISKFDNLKDQSEEEIREAIKYGMDSLTWVPYVQRLQKTLSVLEGSLSSNTEAALVKRYSPVIENDGKYYFYLSGNVFQLNENELTLVDPKSLSSLFLTMIAVTENFKFSGGSLTRFKGNNRITFELNENGKTFKFNSTPVEVNESNDIRNFLLGVNAVKINETSELDMIVKAYENIESFVELDFVQSVVSRNNSNVVNVLRLNENIYINIVNSKNMINEMHKAETANDAIQLVKEYINYDISGSLTDLLEGEAKEAAEIASKRESLFDRIQFLKEQRSKLSFVKNSSNNDAINEADLLLVSEIKKWESELSDLG